MLTEISNPSDLVDDSYEGRKWNPGQYYLYNQETICMSSINKQGYLGKEYPVEKDSNSLRIVLLGDSFTAGRQVKDKYHFRHILEEQLGRKINKKIEVLNFGLDGISFRTMYLKYLLVISKYEPDIIIFIINSPKFFREDNYQMPKLIIENDSLKINFDFNKTAYARMRRNLNFLRNTGFISIAEKVYANIKEKRLSKLIFEKNYSGEEIFVDSAIYGKNSESDVNMINYILRDLKNLQIHNKIIYFMPNVKLTADIEDMIISSNIRLLDPFTYINNLGRNFSDLVYWPITKKRGHLNYEGHIIIGNYLSEIILNDIKK